MKKGASTWNNTNEAIPPISVANLAFNLGSFCSSIHRSFSINSHLLFYLLTFFLSFIIFLLHSLWALWDLVSFRICMPFGSNSPSFLWLASISLWIKWLPLHNISDRCNAFLLSQKWNEFREPIFFFTTNSELRCALLGYSWTLSYFFFFLISSISISFTLSLR